MNKRIAISVLMLSALLRVSFAQDSVKTLIHFPKVKSFGVYISPEFQYAQQGGAFTPMAANAFMLQFNNRFGIGYSSAQLVQRNFSPSSVSPLYLNTSYNGLKMEYTLKPASVVHVSFSLTGGGAFARADSATRTAMPVFDSTTNRYMRPARSIQSGNFAFVQPGFQIETNLLRWAKLYAGASYRVGFATDSQNQLKTSNVQGLSAQVGLKLGWFDFSTEKLNRRVKLK